MWSRQFLVANFNKMDFSHLGGDDETFAHLFPDIKFFTLQKNSGVGKFSSPMKCHQDRWGMAFMMVKGEDWRRSSRKDGCHLPLITEILRLEPLNFCQLDLVEKKGDGHQSSGVAWTPGTPPRQDLRFVQWCCICLEPLFLSLLLLFLSFEPWATLPEPWATLLNKPWAAPPWPINLPSCCCWTSL